MRIMPFMKRKNGVQFAGVGLDTGISTLANKTDLTAIIMTGTTNTSGSTITAGTWFYLNGKLVKAKVDIASNVTFTKDTNYEEKTIGEELIELNSNMIKNNFDSTLVDLTVYDDYDNTYIATADGYVRVGATETGLTGYTAVTIYGGSLENSLNVVCSINNPGIQWASNSMFVKKGMRMCCPEIAEGQQAIFLPLK